MSQRPANGSRSRGRAVWPLAVGLAASAYLATTGAFAARDQLWNDELFTYYFARLPDLRDVWHQLATGVEQTPPLYYVLTRASLWVFGDNNVALRLPGLLGVLAACVCLYAFVARRSSKTHGMIAALLVLGSQAAFYAHEGRPYGLVLGFASAAFLCWQIRGDIPVSTVAVVGMTLSLTLAVACHYYAVLLLVPLVLAEALRSSVRRRVDVPVLAGFAVALVPLVVAAQLIQGARKYSGSFWTEFGWQSAVDFNGWLFLTAVPSWLMTRLELSLFVWLMLGIALHALLAPLWRPFRGLRDARKQSTWLRRGHRGSLVAAASVLATALAVLLLAGEGALSTRKLALLTGGTLVVLAYGALYCRRSQIVEHTARASGLTAAEILAASGFLLLPLLAVVLAKLSTGAFTERYVLPAEIGVAVLLPLGLHQLEGGGRRIASLAVAVGLLALVAHVYRHQAVQIRDDNRARDALIDSLERTAARSDLPIVVADPHHFFELSHYAPPALGGRLLHLSSRQAALRYTGSAITEDGLVVLSRFAPLDVRSFEPYVASGVRFLLLLRPDRLNWMVPALKADGRLLRPYPGSGELMLYDVR